LRDRIGGASWRRVWFRSLSRFDLLAAVAANHEQPGTVELASQAADVGSANLRDLDIATNRASADVCVR
jgi:hypothetical protein